MKQRTKGFDLAPELTLDDLREKLKTEGFKFCYFFFYLLVTDSNGKKLYQNEESYRDNKKFYPTKLDDSTRTPENKGLIKSIASHYGLLYVPSLLITKFFLGKNQMIRVLED